MSSEKFRKFCTKISVSQSLYNQVADPRLGLQLDYKETPKTAVFLSYLRNYEEHLFLQNTYMREPPMAASTADLQTKDLLHKSYRKTSVTASLL